MAKLRVPALFLIMLMRVVIFITTYNTFWRHVPWDVRLSWGADIIGFLVLSFVVLYDDWYFERHVRRFRSPDVTGLP